MRGDFRQRCKEIPDESVHLVFSDAPYDNKSQILYQYAGEVANDKLVDQGSLVVYVGHYAIRNVIDLVLSKSPALKYLWVIAVKHNGGSSVLHGYHVRVEWKPMLWFVKRNVPNIPKYIADLVESTPPDKSLHKWAEHDRSRISDIAYDDRRPNRIRPDDGLRHYWLKRTQIEKEIHRRRIRR
jgi:hypothetical protein